MLQNMCISSNNVAKMGEIYSQDVEYIELETNRLNDGIGLHGATLHHSCMGENLLRTAGVRRISTSVSHHAMRRESALTRRGQTHRRQQAHRTVR